MSRRITADDGTWIDPEELAYPDGGFTRKGLVRLRRNPYNPIALPYGELKRVWLSIADTFFSIPAKLHADDGTVVGYVSTDDAGFTFTPDAAPVEPGTDPEVRGWLS